LKKHYAPKARLVVRAWRDAAELEAFCAELGVPPARVHVLAHSRIPAGFGRVSVMPREPGPLARTLYAELHQCDEAGAELIIVEALPEKSEWRALADRLKRAAAP
jgi:L-threonylcarbamoyladenylate synthase